jgi:hypothetical protein
MGKPCEGGKKPKRRPKEGQDQETTETISIQRKLTNKVPHLALPSQEKEANPN